MRLMRARVATALNRAPSWAVVSCLVLLVAAVCVGMPFAVQWVWPSVDPTVMFLGNLFLGMVMGNAAVLGFLAWRWRVR